MSSSRRTTLFVITIALGVISGVGFILSLPDSWQKLREVVASATAFLPEGQVGNIAIGLLVMALLMLAVGIVIAYREINREQDPSRKNQVEAEPGQAAAIKLLQDQGFTVKDLRQKPPRKWVIGGSVLLMAIAISMIPMAHEGAEEDPGHSIAVANNRAVGGQSQGGKKNSKKQAQPHQADSANPEGGEGASIVGSEGAASPVAEKSSSGSTCICPSPVSSSGSGSSEFVPAPAPEPEEIESEEPEEFEFEEPEEVEPSEAEFEEFEFE